SHPGSTGRLALRAEPPHHRREPASDRPFLGWTSMFDFRRATVIGALLTTVALASAACGGGTAATPAPTPTPAAGTEATPAPAEATPTPASGTEATPVVP